VIAPQPRFHGALAVLGLLMVAYFLGGVLWLKGDDFGE
jgi:hypothetical protein